MVGVRVTCECRRAGRVRVDVNWARSRLWATTERARRRSPAATPSRVRSSATTRQILSSCVVSCRFSCLVSESSSCSFVGRVLWGCERAASSAGAASSSIGQVTVGRRWSRGSETRRPGDERQSEPGRKEMEQGERVRCDEHHTRVILRAVSVSSRSPLLLLALLVGAVGSVWRPFALASRHTQQIHLEAVHTTARRTQHHHGQGRHTIKTDRPCVSSRHDERVRSPAWSRVAVSNADPARARLLAATFHPQATTGEHRQWRGAVERQHWRV